MADTTSGIARINDALAGRYRIEQHIGEGGMADVYLAEDLKHDRKVAMKVLRPELAAVIGAERFLSEIKTTANLQHPHILPLYDSGEADSFLFYVMPLVEGDSLRDRLNSEKQLPVRDAIRIATEVAGALDYAHRHGIIHRDIKPENILLNDGRAMVADFGIALAAKTATHRMTETGMSLGTPHYMSPEQAMGDRDLTPRSDVYALGAMTYEMLLGEPPFTGPTAQSIVAKVMTEKPAGIVSRRPSVPESVEEAVFTALEKLPADRFDSARSFSDALSSSDTRTRQPASAPVTRVSRDFWKRVALGTSAIALLALLFGANSFRLKRVPLAATSVVRFPLVIPPSIRFITQVSAPFAISPDGNTIVFSAADTSGNIALWTRALDDPAPRRLAGTENGAHPSISPNGEWVAFVAGDKILSKVRLAGGSSAMLAELPGVSASLSWESSETILCEIIAPSREIMRVSANGGRPAVAVPFDSAENEVRQRRPLVLRDARVVMYSGTLANNSSSMVMYSLQNGRHSRLKIEGAPLAVIDGLLVYSNDGTLWSVPVDVRGMRVTGSASQLSQRATPRNTGTAVAVSEAGTIVYEDPSRDAISRLELIDFAGVRTKLRDDNRFGSPRFSPDGRRIAVTIRSGSDPATGNGSDIWVLDIASKEVTRITSVGAASSPAWSPDGRRLIYAVWDGSGTEAWSAPVDGSSQAVRLVDAGGDIQNPTVTPDGLSVVLSRYARGDASIELLRIPLDGQKRIDTLVTPRRSNGVRATASRVSPDGRLIAYSDRTGGSVHVKELDGTADIQISAEGGCCALWAPDSRRVFYRSGSRLITVDLETAPVLGVKRRLSSAGFWSTGPIATPYESIQYDLSPDGRTFAAVTPVNAEIRVFVAYNWISELRRESKRAAGR